MIVQKLPYVSLFGGILFGLKKKGASFEAPFES